MFLAVDSNKPAAQPFGEAGDGAEGPIEDANAKGPGSALGYEAPKQELGKNQALKKLLEKMEMGNYQSAQCLHCHRAKRHVHPQEPLEELYDKIVPGGDEPRVSNEERRGLIAEEQRPTAYFNKKGGAFDHYLKNFAGVTQSGGADTDNTTDDTEVDHDDVPEHEEIEGGAVSVAGSGFLSAEENQEHERVELPETEKQAPLSAGEDEELNVTAECPASDAQLLESGAYTTPAAMISGVATTEMVKAESEKEVVDAVVREDASSGPLEAEKWHESVDESASEGLNDTDVREELYDGNNVVEEITVDEERVAPSTSPLMPLEEKEIVSVRLPEMKSRTAEESVRAKLPDNVPDAITLPPPKMPLQEAEEKAVDEVAESKSKKPDPISAMTLSGSKALMAVATTRGLISVYMTGDRFAPEQSNMAFSPKLKPAATEEPIATVLQWGVITTEPLVTVDTHIAAINHIDIVENNQGGGEVAKIITTTTDGYLRCWSLYTDGGAYHLVLSAAHQLATAAVAALPQLNTNQVLVAFPDGDVESYTLDGTNAPPSEGLPRSTFARTTETLNTMCPILHVDVSPSGKMFAVQSTGGWVMLYDAETAAVKGEADCRNRRGRWSNGADVTGVHWNRRETLMLVTTLDSRVRLLTTQPGEEGMLLQLGKFKGHRNAKTRLRAQFAGNVDEYVLCPCEKGYIYVWMHYMDPSKDVYTEDDFIETNAWYVRFQFNAPQLLPHIAVFNPGEWKHLRRLIVEHEKRSGQDLTSLPSAGCLPCPFRAGRGKPETLNVSNMGTSEHILLAAAESGQKIRYTLISMKALNAALSGGEE